MLSPAQSVAEKIKIGVSAPLSGEASTYGFDIRDYIKFASEKLAPGKYELILEDDKCDSKEGVTVAQKFINIDKLKYVIGFGCSGVTLSSAPLYDKAGVLTMVTFASSPLISKAGDYVFRTMASDAEASRVLYEYLKKHVRRLGIISEQTEYAQDFKNSFISNNKQEKIKIDQLDYLPSSTDFRTIVLKIKSQNPEALFINPQAESTFAVILKQVRTIGWNPTIIGAWWPGSPALQQIAKTDLDNTIYVDTPILDALLNSAGKALYQEYKSKGGETRSTEALFASTFEGFRALHLAIQSGEDPRTYLYQNKFQGVFGDYTFDQDGEINGFRLQIKKIENGIPVVLE